MATNKPTTYTKHEPQAATQQRIIVALAGLGDGWHAAKDIAAVLGRDQLYASDRGVLARLLADGVIEYRLQPASITAPIMRYEYRVIGDLPQMRGEDGK